jgi:hypothetical protein
LASYELNLTHCYRDTATFLKISRMSLHSPCGLPAFHLVIFYRRVFRRGFFHIKFFLRVGLL